MGLSGMMPGSVKVVDTVTDFFLAKWPVILTGIPVNMIKLNLRLPKTRISHPVSKLFRPIFEAKRSRGAFGGVLSAAGFVVAMGVYPIAYRSPASALEPISGMVMVETTLSGPARPLPQMTGVSQGFWAGHPGVDITAPLGSQIYPVQPGKVIEVSVSRFDYGRSVVVDHGNGVISRYAHMGKIKVDEGDEVTEKTILGEVGITGHTTGPHLHLEVRKKGVALNPLKYLREI